MSKIIITLEGQVLQEVTLSKERITIGRHRDNDIVLEQRAVSSDHAAIVTILDEAFLEDLGSTNGTFVNGKRVGKHILQPRDVILIAKFHIQFVAGPPAPHGSGGLAKVVVSPDAPRAPAVTADAVPLGQVVVNSGPNAGMQLVLSKPLTTLGRPGLQVVVISRRADGYFIAHIEGDSAARVGPYAVGATPRKLAHGDVIALAGSELTFKLG